MINKPHLSFSFFSYLMSKIVLFPSFLNSPRSFFFFFFSDDFSLSPTKDIFRLTTPTSEPPSCPPRAALPRDLQAWSSWESNEGSEPQLTLQEEVFSFSSQPHSPKRGQGQGDQEKMEKGLDQAQSGSGQRHEARPEDDFIGSESDEVLLDRNTSEVYLECTSEIRGSDTNDGRP